ncbi:hypothetical protein BCR34DRAFT_24461 [Clohesyomyces aquaticus]|uniref:Uncharacterized protein n=1 Tax=Clohesyomyces aquaticus TaxID=1231657 RepID=A0A1Y2A5B5_9PLEO|nr:hypothetical protein BCR34DRAFT_24461 [Clohesyomyces aquaticus]
MTALAGAAASTSDQIQDIFGKGHEMERWKQVCAPPGYLSRVDCRCFPGKTLVSHSGILRGRTPRNFGKSRDEHYDHTSVVAISIYLPSSTNLSHKVPRADNFLRCPHPNIQGSISQQALGLLQQHAVSMLGIFLSVSGQSCSRYATDQGLRVRGDARFGAFQFGCLLRFVELRYDKRAVRQTLAVDACERFTGP